MSKKFISATYGGCEASVKATPAGAIMRVTVDGVGVSRFAASAGDAPALALAILEAAGFESSTPASRTYIETAVRDLSIYVDEMEHAAKEAAEQEAMEARTFDVYKSIYPQAFIGDFRAMGREPRGRWDDLARALHEIRP